MSIQEKQNTPESLTKLVAKGVLYRRAKWVRNLSFLLVALVGILVISVLAVENATFSHVVTLFALATWFLDQIVLKSWESALKKEAATIQEEFDCFVLDLSWPEHKGIDHPTDDRIKHLAAIPGNKSKVNDNLRNWYTPKAIPDDPALAKVRCQRMNCWWDVNLRRKWKTGLIVVGCFFVMLTILVAVVTGTLVAELITLVTSNLRILAWGIGEIQAQSAAIEHVDRIHRYLSTFSDEKRPSEFNVRSVQDEIFEHRHSNPPVPDWLYWRGRDVQELEAAKPLEP